MGFFEQNLTWYLGLVLCVVCLEITILFMDKEKTNECSSCKGAVDS